MNFYPDGMHVVRYEILVEDGWRPRWTGWDDPEQAEEHIQELQHRRDTVGDVRDIELRVYDLVERIG